MELNKHDVYGDCAPDGRLSKEYRAHWETFSLGVFQWVAKSSGKGLKKGNVKVRVKGLTADPDPVFAKAREIAADLDAGTYTGPKTITVK